MANTAFWGMTINNYDDTDLALVRQGYPDFIRQIVYTLERGEEGTPHVQAFIRLFRQQRLSYVKKLFPRGSFKPLTSDEYTLNAQRYAQKLDKTAESPAVISNNPFPDPVVELVSVIEEAFSSPRLNERWWEHPHLWQESQPDEPTLLGWLSQVEFSRVRKTPRLAKFYVGPTYKNVKRDFLHALKAHVFDLHREDIHTHTHTDEEFSVAEGIDDASEDDSEGEVSRGSGEAGEVCEGDEDCESGTDEGYSEGSGDQSDEEDDREGD